MTQKITSWFILLLGVTSSASHADEKVITHNIEVSLYPETQTLQVEDRIRLPAEGPLEFSLHRGLNPHILTPGAELTKTGETGLGKQLTSYRISLPDGQQEITLIYGGKIVHKMHTRMESPGRSHQLLSGTINPEGVFLDSSVAWYPVFPDHLQTFRLNIRLPEGWYAVSQGAGPREQGKGEQRRIVWEENNPQDDIYLIAAPFHLYTHKEDEVEAQVFLRTADPDLAQRYLDATSHYLALYQNLLGPYPYAKFALVENFWETGYGMPSFTLLGSRVLRLPFILHSSYPHEILHNWWGNGVYVDYESGNWSEGLTAYLADHLLKEQQGKGVEYRRNTLQRYADFVRSDNDFPLVEFRSRHTTASQAVGYDKSLMLFHMLRRKLGDRLFIEGLQKFYHDNQFRTAGFDDLQRAFEMVSDLQLEDFFQQWTRRTGAPSLNLSDLKSAPVQTGYRLTGVLSQLQDDDAFQLEVPLNIYLEGTDGVINKTLPVRSKSESFTFDLPGRPVRLDVDPWFDLFRQLHADEAPARFGKLFGAEKILFVLPGRAPQEHLAAYRRMAEQWSQGYPDAKIELDNDLTSLPTKGQVWLMGWQNRFLDASLKAYDPTQFRRHEGEFNLVGEVFEQKDTSLALVNRENPGRIVGIIASNNLEAMKGLTRKIPHYGKYSYLVFSGDAPENRLKGQWQVMQSPLRYVFDQSSALTEAPAPKPLWPVPKHGKSSETQQKNSGT